MADSSSIQTRSKKRKADSSSSKTKNETTTKEVSPQTNEQKTDSPTRASNSPDPNCAICLGKLENKSFTDSCFHMFCFVCLLEWSKVKNECPLCKQQFKSIIHNVRSYEDYDQYHLALYRNHSPEHPYSRSFRYRTTLTEDRVFNLRSRVIGNPVTDPETVLQLQAVGVAPTLQVRVTDFARQDWNRRRQVATSDFRRRIYTNGMHLTGIRGTTNRVRECSPAFFTRNPAMTHRLVPWLNRELNALLYNQESHVQFVLELIMGLIKRFEIRSEEFNEHVSPFIGRHTRHFMKEFEMFAKCPYCVLVYDKKAMYEQLPESVSSDSTSVNSISDDDSDVQFISTEAPPGDRLNDFVSLPDISAEIQVSSTIHSPWGVPFNLQTSNWHSPTPGPSWNFPPMPTLPQRDFIPRLKRSVGWSDTDIDTSSDMLSSAGSDVLVVAYDKPWEDRSPIKLSSDSEPEQLILKQKQKEKSKQQKKRQSGRAKETSTTVRDIVAHSSRSSVSNDLTKELKSPDRATPVPSAEPSTSHASSSRRRSKHKSRSWRDSHYNSRRANVLFHRRSTSPEMSDSGRRKHPARAESPDDRETHFVPKKHSSNAHKRKHKHSSRESRIDDVSQLFASSTSKSHESSSRHMKRCRQESRSPSIEIIVVQNQDRKAKKHKKHKHKHSKIHHKKMKSSVVIVGHIGDNPSQEDTDAYEEESFTTVVPSSTSTSTRTSETSGSSRSFTDLSTVVETLTPVEIAEKLSKANSVLHQDCEGLNQDGVLDLTSVNLEEVDDELLDVGINELDGHLSSYDAKSFKKHPSGHKKSRGTNRFETRPTNTLAHSTIPSSYSNVMIHRDPIFSNTDMQTLYPNVLESFHSAFVSGYNPHAWYRRHIYPNIPFPKLHNFDHRNSNISTSKPSSVTTSSEIVDVESFPLDLTQTQPADNTNQNSIENILSVREKSSTVTSTHAGMTSEDESRRNSHSPTLDVSNNGRRDSSSNISATQLVASSSKSPDSVVIDVSGIETSSSDSERFIDSTQNTTHMPHSSKILKYTSENSADMTNPIRQDVLMSTWTAHDDKSLLSDTDHLDTTTHDRDITTKSDMHPEDREFEIDVESPDSATISSSMKTVVSYKSSGCYDEDIVVKHKINCKPIVQDYNSSSDTEIDVTNAIYNTVLNSYDVDSNIGIENQPSTSGNSRKLVVNNISVIDTSSANYDIDMVCQAPEPKHKANYPIPKSIFQKHKSGYSDFDREIGNDVILTTTSVTNPLHIASDSDVDVDGSDSTIITNHQGRNNSDIDVNDLSDPQSEIDVTDKQLIHPLVISIDRSLVTQELPSASKHISSRSVNSYRISELFPSGSSSDMLSKFTSGAVNNVNENGDHNKSEEDRDLQSSNNVNKDENLNILCDNIAVIHNNSETTNQWKPKCHDDTSSSSFELTDVILPKSSNYVCDRTANAVLSSEKFSTCDATNSSTCTCKHEFGCKCNDNELVSSEIMFPRDVIITNNSVSNTDKPTSSVTNQFASHPKNMTLASEAINYSVSPERLFSLDANISNNPNPLVTTTATGSDVPTVEFTNQKPSVATFWKKRLMAPIVNSSWRNEVSNDDSEVTESSSSDSYDDDSNK